MSAVASPRPGTPRAGGRARARTAGGAEVPAISAAQMAEVDRLAVEEFGIDLLQMMEQAGSHLAELARRLLGGDLRGKRVVVAVGPGNNGGGGLAAARHLVDRGAIVRCVLSRPALRLSVAGRHQLATLLAMEVSCCVATFDLDDVELADVLGSADLVIDALLGYNSSGAPRDEIRRIVDAIAQAGRPVLSLDLPTGVDADTGQVAGPAIRAMATMALALPKTGLLNAAGPLDAVEPVDAAGPLGRAGSDRVGDLYLADIGLPSALYRRLGIDVGTPFAAERIVSLAISA